MYTQSNNTTLDYLFNVRDKRSHFAPVEIDPNNLLLIQSVAGNVDKYGCIKLTHTLVNDKPETIVRGNVQTEGAGQFFAKASGEVANSRYASGGYNQPLDTLTFLATELIKQEVLSENIELINAIETKVGSAPFLQNVQYPVSAINAGSPTQHKIAVNHNGEIRKIENSVSYFASTRNLYAYSIGQHFLQSKQIAASNVIGLSFEDTLQSMLEVVANHQNVARAFGSESTKGWQGGLFTFNEGNDPNLPDTSAISKPFSQMTLPEIEQAITNMVNVAKAKAKNVAVPDIFVFPWNDTLTAYGVRVPDVASLTYVEEAIRKQIIASTGVQNPTIILSKYADKSVNAEFGINKSIYMTLCRKQAKAFFDLPVPFEMLMQPHMVGFEFQALGYTQIGQTVVGRPDFAQVFNPTVE